MNKQEFIKALRDELSKLPPEEIVDATEYFEECFAEATDGLDDDARTAEEERLAAEFGSPKRIAAQIKADYAARILDTDEKAAGENPGTKKKLSAVWWIIIGICSAPVAIPLVISIFVMVLAICIAVIACFIGGIAAAVVGIGALAKSAAGGIMTIGIGFMLAAASAAAGFGIFLGIREIVRAVAKSVRKSNEEKMLREVEKESGAKEAEKDDASGTDEAKGTDAVIGEIAFTAYNGGGRGWSGNG